MTGYRKKQTDTLGQSNAIDERGKHATKGEAGVLYSSRRSGVGHGPEVFAQTAPALSSEPDEVLGLQLTQLEGRISKLQRFHRPAVALLLFLLAAGILHSDFFYKLRNSFGYAVDASFVFKKEVTVACNEIGYDTPSYAVDCGAFGGDSTTTKLVQNLPLKWFVLTMALAIFVCNEWFKTYCRKLQTAAEKLRRQFDFVQTTHKDEFVEVMERLKFGVASCPTCGRTARVPPTATVSLTCGSCGKKWASGPVDRNRSSN